MRHLTDAVILLCFALTALYVGSRLFPEVTQAKRQEVEQWWQDQQKHIETEQQRQRLKPSNRTAQH